MANKVEICGINTAQLPILSNKKMDELLRKIHQGDTNAREEFVTGNLRLVLSVVQRFMHRGENADDLFQVGCIGLMKAIDHFDIEMNVRFSTYAVPMVIGEIRRYLRDNNAIRVSRSMRDTAYRAMQARERLAAANGKEPDIEQIAQEIEMKPSAVAAALEAVMEPVSIYEPIYHDGTDAIYVLDQMGDDKNTEEKWSENLALKDAVEELSERERSILYLRYFVGKTQMEIAGEIGISQAQVSRLEKGALSRVKRQM